MDGGDGDDSLYGAAGNDELIGGSGNDTLQGDYGNDKLTGGTGNDTLHGGRGSDTYYWALGDGDDTITEYYNSLHSNTIAIEAEGITASDLLWSSDGYDLLLSLPNDGTVETLTFKNWLQNGFFKSQVLQLNDDTLSLNDIDWSHIASADDNIIYDSYASNTLEGGAGNDTIYGDVGNDTLYGGADNDTLAGGDGNDALDGGTGNDVLHSGHGNDTLLGGDGNDTLYGRASYNLYTAHYDTHNYGDDTLDGGDGDDRLYGAAGNDKLTGGTGNDTLYGGKGNDSLAGGEGDDHYYYNRYDGHDIIDDTDGLNTLVFGNNISKEDVVFSQQDNDLLLSLSDGDSLLLKNAITQTVIDKISFNGEVHELNDLLAVEPPQMHITDGVVHVTQLSNSATWEYTLNGGLTWQTGSGSSFTLPVNPSLSTSSTLAVTSAQTVTSLSSYASNTGSDVLYLDITTSAINNQKQVLFESGGSLYGITVFIHNNDLKISLGANNQVDLLAENVFLANTRYAIAIDINNDNDTVTVNMAPKSGDALPTLIEVATASWESDVPWSGSNNAGWGKKNSAIQGDNGSGNINDFSDFAGTFNEGRFYDQQTLTDILELSREATYAAEQIQVKQTNPLGLVSDITSNTESITVANPLIPAAPTINIVDAEVHVGNLTDQATWKYTLDGGHTWQAGTDTSFTLPVHTTLSSASTLAVTSAQTVASLSGYASNAGSDVLYLDVTTSSINNQKQVLFESGGATYGINVFMQGNDLKISLGVNNRVDLLAEGVFLADTRYVILIDINNDDDTVTVSMAPKAGDQLPIITEVATADWEANTPWSGSDYAGWGKKHRYIQGDNGSGNVNDFIDFTGTFNEGRFYANQSLPDVWSNAREATYNENQIQVRQTSTLGLVSDTTSNTESITVTNPLIPDTPTINFIDNEISVGNLSANGTWEYTLDGGDTWQTGSGSSFALPVNSSLCTSSTLAVTSAQTVASLSSYASNAGSDVLYLDITTGAINNEKQVLFESGGSVYGITVFIHNNDLKISLGANNQVDLLAEDIFLANTRYAIAIDINNDNDTVTVNMAPKVGDTLPVLTEIATANWEANVAWSGGNAAGWGRKNSSIQGDNGSGNIDDFSDFAGTFNEGRFYANQSLADIWSHPREITYDENQIKVRQTGPQGLVSDVASNTESITVMNPLVPATPTINMVGSEITVGDLSANATWEYTLDAGLTWQTGTGSSFILPVHGTLAQNSTLSTTTAKTISSLSGYANNSGNDVLYLDITTGAINNQKQVLFESGGSVYGITVFIHNNDLKISLGANNQVDLLAEDVFSANTRYTIAIDINNDNDTVTVNMAPKSGDALPTLIEVATASWESDVPWSGSNNAGWGKKNSSIQGDNGSGNINDFSNFAGTFNEGRFYSNQSLSDVWTNPPEVTYSVGQIQVRQTSPTGLVSDVVNNTEAVTFAGGVRVTDVHQADPIILDLDGDGVELISLEDSAVFYPIHQDGAAYKMAWVSQDDGLLAYDINNDGLITQRGEISFVDYVAGAQTDLEGLHYFDTNNNGLLDAGDNEWQRFGVWQDSNLNGKTDAGEYQSLTDLGIQSITLTSDNNQTILYGNQIHGMGSYTLTSGETKSFADASLLTSSAGFTVDANGNYTLTSQYTTNEVVKAVIPCWVVLITTY